MTSLEKLNRKKTKHISLLKFEKLEIPEKLVSAQGDAKLVIFAGAGISLGDPANLPSFHELAEQVCAAVIPKESEPLEKVLGRYSDTGVNIHSRVKTLFEKHMKQENNSVTELHKNIPRLFKRGDLSAIRIVTTNFDTYLSQTVPEGVKGYSAPALPLSGEFSGLVYLHGSINDETTMVLTDRDFSRAYMSEGWAREFLLKLYERYSILFIGYSHEDELVSYLARGMNLRDRNVFALCGDSEDELAKWDHLGITAISYPNKNFSALQEGVKKWADEVQSNFFSRQQRFSKILDFGLPIPESENEGFLKRHLMTPGITEKFTRKVKSPDWCAWVIENGLGDFIHDEVVPEDHFTVSFPWQGSKFHLGYWLAGFFVRDVKLLNLALKRHGHGLSWPLTHALVDSINREKISSEKDYGYLCTLLLTECSHILIGNFHTSLLGKCVEKGFYRAALVVLRELLKPKTGMELYISDLKENPSVDIEYFELNFTGKMLLEFCLDNNNEFIEHCCREIFDICVSSLSAIEEMNRGAMENAPYSWIEVRDVDYSTDSSHTPLAAICYLAVMCLEKMLERKLLNNPVSFSTYLAGSKSPLVRRIAVHILLIAPDVSCVFLAEWLKGSDLILSYPEYHEVFLLIRKMLSESDETSICSFLDFLKESYNAMKIEDEGRTDALQMDYYTHLAYYLSVRLPESDRVQEFYREVQETTEYRHLRISSPEYPSEGRETEEYFKSEFKLKPLPELIEMASSLNISLKDEYLNQLMIAIGKDTEKAFKALEILVEGEPDVNIAKAVLDSLATNLLSNEADYNRYLKLLDSGKFFVPFYLSEIFSVYCRTGHGEQSYENLLTELKVCKAFWESEQSGTLIDSYCLDESTSLFFLSTILCRIVDESNDAELTKVTLHFIEELIKSRVEVYLPLFRSLGESLYRLFGASRNWTEAQLLPLFSPSYSCNEVAEALWDGFFRIVNDRCKEMELLEPALIESCKAGLISTDSRNFHQMILKRLFSKYSPELADAMVAASDDKGLSMVAFRIKCRDEMNADFDRLWSSWVRDYFIGRLNSQGKTLGSNEFSQILLYAVENAQVYADLGDLLRAYSGPFERSAGYFVNASRKSGFHLKEPSLASQYLAQMVAGSSYSATKTGKDIVNFIEEILSENPDEHDSLLPVLEHYGMAGVPEARIVYEKYADN